MDKAAKDNKIDGFCTLPVASASGECSQGNPCVLGEGNCLYNSDCKSGLICHRRQANEDVEALFIPNHLLETDKNFCVLNN